jgi:(4-(4-[2-(gamma-L-glutamylamino)ethyl]phenoxymethyl)furan-2-yl)methanamine synthase
MSWLALDIGGANLKAADGRGWTQIAPFELWKKPAELPSAVAALIDSAPSAEGIAVTMTGELCDCFATKADGVRHILASVAAAAGGRDVAVYLVDGRFVSVDEALEAPRLAAASNWHALARFACRYVVGEIGLLIDIGSTTTDIIPLVDGLPHPYGWNDTERLLAGELVYMGIGRTPICAITQTLPWRGRQCPVAAELFATAADAYVILECIAEQEDVTATADGRPLTIPCAQSRLARMICADAAEFNAADAREAAEAVEREQWVRLERALRRVVARLTGAPHCIAISGSGEFLARRLAQAAADSANLVSLGDRLGPGVSVAATAHALAVLACELAA